ncbi:MAG TPA: RNA polymerase sigma factor [Polyangiaceae bacterium]|nr:RNA polymerase sigma factor [Polyangiaceae bacterium]
MNSRANKLDRSPLRLVPGGGETREPTSDEELIDAVQRGDHRITRLLYDRLYGVVDQTLYRVFGRREHDHDDLVQAAFEQIVLTLSRQSYARACNLRTWAASITSHVGFTALRSRKRERKVVAREVSFDSSLVPTRTVAENVAAASLELDRVRRHLLSMKSEQAETVFLHDVLGHQLAEVALIMRVSVAAATSRLVRGRRELYRRIDSDTKIRGE